MLDRCRLYGDRGFWNRKSTMEGFRSRKITAVVRKGDRTDPGHVNYIPPNEPLAIRFIEGFGEPKVGVPGNLVPDEGLTFERTECFAKKIEELTPDDLAGCAPDCATPELVRFYLAALSPVGKDELPPWDTVVTIWRFKYLPDTTEESETR